MNPFHKFYLIPVSNTRTITWRIFLNYFCLSIKLNFILKHMLSSSSSLILKRNLSRFHLIQSSTFTVGGLNIHIKFSRLHYDPSAVYPSVSGAEMPKRVLSDRSFTQEEQLHTSKTTVIQPPPGEIKNSLH